MNIAINKKTVLSVFAAVALIAGVVIAAPPTSMYNPGETTDPTCAPGDTNCDVKVRGKFVDGVNPADAVYTEGNVGIGKTNPEARLHVAGSILLGNKQSLQWKDNTGNILNIMRVDVNNILTLRSAQANGIAFQVEDNVGENSLLTIMNNGNVGIGNNNPLSKFSILGLPQGANDSVVSGNLVGALCITNQGNVYIDTDGTCAN